MAPLQSQANHTPTRGLNPPNEPKARASTAPVKARSANQTHQTGVACTPRAEPPLPTPPHATPFCAHAGGADPYPYGLALAHAHWSRHISSTPLVASHPNTSLAVPVAA